MSQTTTIESIETFDDPGRWMGYTFVMSDPRKNITCKIENQHHCCEKWGTYTACNLNDFIGAQYYGVYVSKIKKKKHEEMKMLDVKITTNRGSIKFHVYNEHNGYYAHDVFIQSDKGSRMFAL